MLSKGQKKFSSGGDAGTGKNTLESIGSRNFRSL
jgi:hypothetical protein